MALAVCALAFVFVPDGWIGSPSIRYKVAGTAKGEQDPSHIATRLSLFESISVMIGEFGDQGWS